MFGEDLPAVDGDIVDSVAAGYQGDFGVGELLAQSSLQTGGAGQVVSARAVGYFNFHLYFRCVRWRIGGQLHSTG